MTKLRIALTVAALVSFAATVTPAKADTFETFNWTTGGTGVSGELPAGSGTITVDTSLTKVVSGFTGDTITGITGFIGTDTISSLVAVNGGNGGNNDNLLFVNGSPEVLDTTGFSFLGSVSGVPSSTPFTLFSSCPLGSMTSGPGATCTGPNPIGLEGPGGTFLSLGQGTFTIAPVPLPASVWMMILGLGGLGSVGLRARKQS